MPFEIKYLLVMQLGVEVVLVVLLILIWQRTKKTSESHQDEGNTSAAHNFKNSMENFLQESEKIAQTFSENLKTKKELSAGLILKLDRRLSDYQALLKQTESALMASQKKLAELSNSAAAKANSFLSTSPHSGGKANPAAPEVRALVLQMSKNGHSPEDIAAKAHLHIGEVELIIDLERQFNV
ncbi:MAG: hypothetical protein ACRCTY_08865 [Candidatus Adiutrix sp.]